MICRRWGVFEMKLIQRDEDAAFDLNAEGGMPLSDSGVSATASHACNVLCTASMLMSLLIWWLRRVMYLVGTYHVSFKLSFGSEECREDLWLSMHLKYILANALRDPRFVPWRNCSQ